MSTYQILINWNAAIASSIDESAYLIDWHTRIGVDANAAAPFDRCSAPGEAIITLDNATQRFSAANPGRRSSDCSCQDVKWCCIV